MRKACFGEIGLPGFQFFAVSLAVARARFARPSVRMRRTRRVTRLRGVMFSLLGDEHDTQANGRTSEHNTPRAQECLCSLPAASSGTRRELCYPDALEVGHVWLLNAVDDTSHGSCPIHLRHLPAAGRSHNGFVGVRPSYPANGVQRFSMPGVYPFWVLVAWAQTQGRPWTFQAMNQTLLSYWWENLEQPARARCCRLLLKIRGRLHSKIISAGRKDWSRLGPQALLCAAVLFFSGVLCSAAGIGGGTSACVGPYAVA